MGVLQSFSQKSGERNPEEFAEQRTWQGEKNKSVRICGQPNSATAGSERADAGLSHREAAQRLGMNEGALEGYLSRGMRTLAKAVFSDPPAGDPQSDAWEPDDESRRGKRIV